MKAIVSIGYLQYVVEVEEALLIAKAIAGAERYKKRWQAKELGGTTYHIWTETPDEPTSIETLSDELYRLAKLAGSPEEKEPTF